MITNDAKIFYKIFAEDLSVEVLSFVSSHLPFPMNNFRCNFFFVVVGEKRKGISQNFERGFFAQKILNGIIQFFCNSVISE